jgi:hypothetical protein
VKLKPTFPVSGDQTQEQQRSLLLADHPSLTGDWADKDQIEGQFNQLIRRSLQNQAAGRTGDRNLILGCGGWR